jgi:hypothetical protein
MSSRNVAAALLCAVTFLAIPATSNAAIPAADKARLHKFAVGEAKALHEKHPTKLRAVRTTWGKVRKAFASGPHYRAKRVVYVVAMNGTFIDRGGHKHARDNIVYDAKTIKPLVAYFDFALPTSLGSPSRI